ncbi:MAG TPA: hypothetical protein VLA15_08565, partial [Desulfurivibrionaceae bacterium]|nr:hypothetical protein [Desulfurivibrionaceae bacterium]
MSYILEALKKSDRERKQGKIPDLGTVQDPHFRFRRRRRISPFFLLGLLALGAAIWGAWFFWRGEEPAFRTTVATPP